MRDVYDGWQKSSHHAAAVCNDCHVPHDFLGKWLVKASSGYHHSTAFTFQNFHEPIQMHPSSLAVLNHNCVYCHGDLTSEIRGTALSDGARAHGSEPELDCVRC